MSDNIHAFHEHIRVHPIMKRIHPFPTEIFIYCKADRVGMSQYPLGFGSGNTANRTGRRCDKCSHVYKSAVVQNIRLCSPHALLFCMRIRLFPRSVHCGRGQKKCAVYRKRKATNGGRVCERTRSETFLRSCVLPYGK